MTPNSIILININDSFKVLKKYIIDKCGACLKANT